MKRRRRTTRQQAPHVGEIVTPWRLRSYADELDASVIKLQNEIWQSGKVQQVIIDGSFDYFGFKTLERSYLLKLNGKVAERPQQLFMRVAVGIHKGDIQEVIKTYNMLSEGWFTHATPTLFNAGTPKPQMSSCFLLQMQSDSIDGIYNTLKQTALISQSAGGIGLSIHSQLSDGQTILF